jgi:hypothetical protein
MPAATAAQKLFLGRLNDALTTKDNMHLNYLLYGYNDFRLLYHIVINSNMPAWQEQLKAMNVAYGDAECITRFLLYEQVFLAQCIVQLIMHLFDVLQIPKEVWPVHICMSSMLTRINNMFIDQELYGELATLRAAAALSVWHFKAPLQTVVTINHMNVPLVLLLLPTNIVQLVLMHTPYGLQDCPEYLTLKSFADQIMTPTQEYFALLSVSTQMCDISVLRDTRNMLQLYWAMIKQQHAPLSWSLSVARYMDLSLLKSNDQARLLAIVCKPTTNASMDLVQQKQNQERVLQAQTQLFTMHYMFAGLLMLYNMWVQ